MNLKTLIFTSTCCILLGLKVNAQKIPNKQDKSIWGPTKAKGSGDADKWDKTYESMNSATSMFYTISNDENNIYLSAYIKDATAIFYKVMTGGITFLLKTDEDQITTQYPIFDHINRPRFVKMLSEKYDPATKTDSAVIINNYTLLTNAKDIHIKDPKAADTLISIYNDKGIRAVGVFDKQLGYHYDLCVPLKYLGGYNLAKTVKYQVMLNGGPNKYVPTGSDLPRVFNATNADGTPVSNEAVAAANEKLVTGRYALYATTNFGGEYKLAKKP